ncbi:MAG: phosphoenolpyruvate synthase [Coleofasciculus sp. G3-WIS-01]|uniref:phosphoenolpyruvate synthase n=1 Tax=Coleofasciculus sp. G3-WIS-01 TaxID=3069528 RepID=UPI0032F7D182
MTNNNNQYICWFENLTSDDVSIVGGKNASLGEMIRSLKDEGVRVPDGFATTADAYRKFLEANQLNEKIKSHLSELESDKTPLEKVGKSIRKLFHSADFPEDIASKIREAYDQLSQRYDTQDVDIAARSSATAEDLPEASFAGQQETFLNVTGYEELLEACRKCYASLFTDRAISYRQAQGFDHLKVALSVGVQKMVRSDKSSAGVMFSLDTETGFPDVVVIDAAWGLGENVVQGSVTPDEYRVFKPLLEDANLKPIIEKKQGAKEQKMIYAKGGSETTQNIDTSSQERNSFVLNDEEILQLGQWASAIEAHYQKPMDMEWAKDGDTGDLFIVPARPETVQSQKEAGSLKTYSLKEKGKEILSGLSIGDAIAAGKVCRIKSAADIDRFEENTILVTGMTDPDWVPIMKKAAGIVTDQGGRTCHAAIVSRELGIPAIVGTGDATSALENGQEITISCAEGDRGLIYQGILEYEESELNLEEIPKTQTQIMMNVASPDAAFRWWRLPCEGIGLARMEFIINNVIKIHPMALIHWDELEDEDARQQIQDLTQGYEDKTEYFVDNLARGIAKIPSNVELAEEFSERFDGFSIGSNDLTQLVLGVDRDSGDLSHLFDERNLALKKMIRRLIKTAHQCDRKVGICGQAPSDHPDFAAFLVEAGIDSISLNPDSVSQVKQQVAQQEGKR